MDKQRYREPNYSGHHEVIHSGIFRYIQLNHFVTFYIIFGNTLFLLLSFRKETLDLPAQSRYPPPLPCVGPTWLVAHGVIHSLGDLYLHLLVCLVWPQSLTLDADHPLPGLSLCPRLGCPP